VTTESHEKSDIDYVKDGRERDM